MLEMMSKAMHVVHVVIEGRLDEKVDVQAFEELEGKVQQLEI